MDELTSRERVAKAFAHQEPDRVPLFELSIDSSPAAAIMGREMWVGSMGANARRANQMAAVGAAVDFTERMRRDTLDLWHALGLDMIVVPRPERYAKWLMKTLGKHHWRFTDPLTGYWEEFVYTPHSNTYAQVGSSIDDGDERDFERYIAALEHIEHRPQDYDLESLDRWLEGSSAAWTASWQVMIGLPRLDR